jgi:hypothetical protein
MANVGTYILANNTGNFDQLIMMTDILYQNIQQIVQERAAAGYSGADLYPTIGDIEASHAIIPRNSYKPYVPIAFQYLKQSSTSGTVTWGQQVSYQLQNFGEFYWDAYGLISLGSVTATVDTTSLATGVANIPLAAPTGSSTTKNFTGVYYRYVDSYLNTIPALTGAPSAGVGGLQGQPTTSYSTANVSAPSAQNYLYYCDNLAHNIFKAHEFDVNSTPVDQYTSFTDTFYLNVLLPDNKRSAYLRCIGQELPLRGVYSGFGYDQTAPSGSGATGMSTTLAGSASAFSTNPPTTDVYGSPTARHTVGILNGPQTPKKVQPALSLIYPYKFDFCNSPTNALPVLQIPGAIREIKSTFNAAANVLFMQSPVFLETTNVLATGSGSTVVYTNFL